MTAPLLLQFGLPILAEIVGSALKTVDNPVARGAAASLGKVGEMLNAGTITPEQLAEANRHAERLAELKMSESQAAYEQVNESLRAEIASSDMFVRRMRPTFGYLMAVTWAAQMFAISYIIIFRTADTAYILEAMESLGMIWAIGLSILGVYFYRRNEEKRSIAPFVAPPMAPPAGNAASVTSPAKPSSPSRSRSLKLND